MDQCKVSYVPMQHNTKLYCDDGSKEVNDTMYRHMVGSLNYLTTTRPDIAYSISVLSHFMEKPLEIHWNAAKGVLRYLKGTLDYGIKYTNSFDVEMMGYSDSDWAGNPDYQRSTIGYDFGIRSGIVSWSSKKKHIVYFSSTEEEYKSLCKTTCEVVWLRRLLQDVGEEQKKVTIIKCDNQSSIKLANNSVCNSRTKHVDTQFHFIQQKM